MKPLSPSSQPSPVKGEGGSGSIDPIAKGTSPEGEGFRPSPKGTLRNASSALKNIFIILLTFKEG
jgi:hypothetical protein